MSVPPGTEMFQFPGFASRTYEFSARYLIEVGCPIRTPRDQRLLAAPPSFSQRATSFFASWRQGIHQMPFSYSKPPTHTCVERRRLASQASHRTHPTLAIGFDGDGQFAAVSSQSPAADPRSCQTDPTHTHTHFSSPDPRRTAPAESQTATAASPHPSRPVRVQRRNRT